MTIDLFMLLLYLDRFVHTLRPVAVASGAIQAVNAKGIVRVAAARDMVCVMPLAVGDFVTAGGVLFESTARSR